MGHGQARVRVYEAPPEGLGPTANPRLVLQGAMPAAWADLLTLVLQVGAFARRLPFTLGGTTAREAPPAALGAPPRAAG